MTGGWDNDDDDLYEDYQPPSGRRNFREYRPTSRVHRPSFEVILPEEDSDDRRPIIRLAQGALPEAATAGEDSLIAGGRDIYQRGSQLVRPVVHEVDAGRGRKTMVPQLHPIGSVHLRDLLARDAHWQCYSTTAKKHVAADPPGDVVQIILERYGEWRFPLVVSVINTPTLRPDGTLLCQAGYDAITRLVLLDPPPMPDVAPEPSRQDAEAALALLDQLLEESPLIGPASHSVALSAMITPVCRAAFPSAPLHAFTSPVAGSGKSHLVDLASAIAVGQPAPVIAAGRDEAELEKRLGAQLLTATPILSVDNVNGTIGGDALCQAIERPLVDIRLLGRSERVRIEARGTTFYATGNNLQLTGDLTRRALIARLDPMLERPELRQYSSNPIDTVLADRGRYIAAALTIVRAYIVAGRPQRAARLASFSDWSDTVRSALMWLGCDDPCASMEVSRAEDPKVVELRDVLVTWEAAIGVGHVARRSVSQVVEIAERQATSGWAYPELRVALRAVAGRGGEINSRSLGRWLARNKDRIVAGLSVSGEADGPKDPNKWWIDRHD